MTKPKVALFVSHPIQHFCPQYASLQKSEVYDFKVFFASKLGSEPYEDKNFRKTVSWSNLRLNEFNHVFLNQTSIPISNRLDAENIANELNNYNPNVVIIYGYAQRFQERVIKWAKSNGSLIYYISDSENHHHESILKKVYKWFKLRPHFRKLDRFLTVGNANEFYYQSYGVPTQRMTRMQFSVDIELLESSYLNRFEARKQLREALGIDEKSIVISVVGKFVPWKRQLDAIKAVCDLPENIPVKLLLIGSGPDEEKLVDVANKACPNRVVFSGFVCPSKLPDYYCASDIYLHCSEHEPHSLAISEAIYLGLPLIISHRCGSYGPLDDLQPGRNGFLYNTGDTKELTSQIQRLATNESLREEFSRNSRTYAVESQQRAHKEFLLQALRADNLLQ